jgi:hypothetical protein
MSFFDFFEAKWNKVLILKISRHKIKFHFVPIQRLCCFVCWSRNFRNTYTKKREPSGTDNKKLDDFFFQNSTAADDIIFVGLLSSLVVDYHSQWLVFFSNE